MDRQALTIQLCQPAIRIVKPDPALAFSWLIQQQRHFILLHTFAVIDDIDANITVLLGNPDMNRASLLPAEEPVPNRILNQRLDRKRGEKYADVRVNLPQEG